MHISGWIARHSSCGREFGSRSRPARLSVSFVRAVEIEHVGLASSTQSSRPRVPWRAERSSQGRSADGTRRQSCQTSMCLAERRRARRRNTERCRRVNQLIRVFAVQLISSVFKYVLVSVFSTNVCSLRYSVSEQHQVDSLNIVISAK